MLSISTTKRNTKVLMVIFSILTGIAMIRLYVLTSGFSLLPNQFYYVYEGGVNSVLYAGNLNVLKVKFDNFASSPGTIILNCYLSLISGLNLILISSIEGILVYLLYTLLIFLLLRKLYDNLNYKIAFISLISSGFPAIIFPIFTYSHDAYLLFLMVFLLIISNVPAANTKIEHVVLFVILVTSIVIKYLPMGIYMLTIIILFLLMLRALRVKKVHITPFIFIMIIIILGYFIFWGQFFFTDFRSFIQTIAKSLTFKQLMFNQQLFLTQLQYGDSLYRFFRLLSMLRFTVIFLVLMQPLLFLIEGSPKSSRLKTVLIIGLLGSLLYTIGIIPYFFVGFLSDYGMRILFASHAFYTITIYNVLLSLYKRNQNVKSRLFNVLKFLIMAIALVATVGSLLSPIVKIYEELMGFNLSNQYKYGYEGLSTSTFIKETLDHQRVKIVGSYRYIYLFSRYGISYMFIDYTSVNEIAKYNVLIVIPIDITKKPDAKFGPIPYEVFQGLVLSKNIILNTGLSVSLV